MRLIIDIPEDVYKKTIFYREFRDLNDCVTTIKALENGTPIPDNATVCDIEQMRKDISLLKDHEQTDTHTVTLYTWKHMKEKVLQIIDKYTNENNSH